MAHRIQLRGGTAGLATSTNPILREREIGVETDTGLFKVGDGSTDWNSLPYGGLTGHTGDYWEFRYQNAAEQPSAPTGETPSGWALFPTSPPDGEYTWLITAQKDYQNILQNSWSTPMQLSGIKGDQGLQGEKGDQGPMGSVAVAWDSATTYSKDAPVFESGILWLSLIDDNLNNIPSGSVGTYWKRGDNPDQIWTIFLSHPDNLWVTMAPVLPDEWDWIDVNVTPLPKPTTKVEIDSKNGHDFYETIADTMGQSNVNSYRDGEYYVTYDDQGANTGATVFTNINTWESFPVLVLGARVRINRLGAQTDIMEIQTNTGDSHYIFGKINGDGRLICVVHTPAGTGVLYSSSAVVLGEWMHLAFIFDLATGTFGISIDGIYEESPDTITPGTEWPNVYSTIKFRAAGDYLDTAVSFDYGEPFFSFMESGWNVPLIINTFYNSGLHWGEINPTDIVNLDNLHLAAKTADDKIQAHNPIALPAPAVDSGDAVQKVQVDYQEQLTHPDAEIMKDYLAPERMDVITLTPYTTGDTVYSEKEREVFYDSSAEGISFTDVDSKIEGEKYAIKDLPGNAYSQSLEMNTPIPFIPAGQERIVIGGWLRANPTTGTRVFLRLYEDNGSLYKEVQLQMGNDVLLYTLYWDDVNGESGVYDFPSLWNDYDWHFVYIAVEQGSRAYMYWDGSKIADIPISFSLSDTENPIKASWVLGTYSSHIDWFEPFIFSGTNEECTDADLEVYRNSGKTWTTLEASGGHLYLNAPDGKKVMSNKSVVGPGTDATEDAEFMPKSQVESFVETEISDNLLDSGVIRVKRLLTRSCNSFAGFLTTDNKIYSFCASSNDFQSAAGIVGEARMSPTQVRFKTDPTELQEGRYEEIHTIVDASYEGCNSWALFDNGDLWTWGDNGNGQLGLGDTTDRNVPTLSLTGVSKVFHMESIGYSLSASRKYVLKTDGTLWFTGYNAWGNAGNGGTTTVTLWEQITFFAADSIRELWHYGNSDGSVFVQTIDGNIYAWGCNAHGQLGLGNTTDQTTPQLVTSAWGGTDEIEKVGGLAGGNDGSNTRHHGTAVMLKKDGRLFTCGRGGTGILGNGSTDNISTPYHVSVVGTVVDFRTNTSSYWGTISIIDSNNCLWAWGYNGRGQVGNGTTTNQLTPYQHTTYPGNSVSDFPANHEFGTHVDPYATPLFIRSTDGLIWAVGDGGAGILCNGETSDKSTYSLTYLPSDIVDIVCMSYNEGQLVCNALDSKGRVWSWGYGGRYLVQPYHYGTVNVYIPIKIKL